MDRAKSSTKSFGMNQGMLRVGFTSKILITIYSICRSSNGNLLYKLGPNNFVQKRPRNQGLSD